VCVSTLPVLHKSNPQEGTPHSLTAPSASLLSSHCQSRGVTSSESYLPIPSCACTLPPPLELPPLSSSPTPPALLHLLLLRSSSTPPLPLEAVSWKAEAGANQRTPSHVPMADPLAPFAAPVAADGPSGEGAPEQGAGDTLSKK